MSNIWASRWLVLVGVVLPGTLTAQIVTDGSAGIGPGGPLAGPAFNIPESLGTLSGSNLFHSFSTFNVLVGESATFTTDSSSILNVVSRVTGDAQSTINGRLSLVPLNGGAPNLFLINPNGLAFGAGAQVDVPAAFHVSTADYLTFVGSDEVFSADSEAVSTFSAAAPEAFGFLGGNGDITFSDIERLPAPPDPFGSVREASAFTTSLLDVAAANIDWDQSRIGETGGSLNGLPRKKIDVRMVATGVDADAEPLMVPLRGPLSVAPAGDIQLTASDIEAGDYGSIELRSGTVSLENSTLASNITGLGPDAGGEAGTIAISASGDVNILGPSQLVFHTATLVGLQGSISIVSNGAITMAPDAADPLGEGPTLDISGRILALPSQGIIIHGNSVSLTNTTMFTSVRERVGSSISLTSNGDLTLTGSSIGASNPFDDLAFGGGDITLTSLNGGDISVSNSILKTVSNTSREGETPSTGLIKLDTIGQVTLNNADITATAESRTPGTIDLRGSQIILTGTTKVSATRTHLNENIISGRGGLGYIELEATEGISLGGTSVIEARIVGDVNVRDGNSSPTAGEIRLTTPLLEFVGDGTGVEPTISTQVDGDVGASAIVIESPESPTGGRTDLTIRSNAGRGVITSSVECPPAGCSIGAVILDPPGREPGFSGSGNAGDITINAADLTLSGIDIFSRAGSGTSGQAGTIQVNSDALRIIGAAGISSASTGAGPAGNVILTVGSFRIDPGSPVSLLIGPGSIVETSSAASAGGDILVSTDGTVFLDGSSILTSAQGLEGDDSGGDITITKPTLLILRSGDIDARANQGTGGNIKIDTVGLIKSGDSVIDASSQNNVDGTVSTNAENTVSAAVDIEPPRAGPPDALGRRCSPAELMGRSTFVVHGTRPADIQAPYLPVDGLASAVMENQSVVCATQSPAR